MLTAFIAIAILALVAATVAVGIILSGSHPDGPGDGTDVIGPDGEPIRRAAPKGAEPVLPQTQSDVQMIEPVAVTPRPEKKL